ncbi:hypothetical protein N8T08_010840 [Aspergillus melleus]|uniref:Uncharacterized protein n=1 Tax=Aspergillus melleus TaxID=138277 RepID=A0ACC3BBV8_9EURO|nr:hypothetical protein N8T08_010840 [Aspergillus melleus]
MDDPTVLYLALFGAALPFSYDSRLDTRSSDAYWKYSKRQIMLEALTILVLDISGMTHGPQVWGPMALATKHAVHLRNVRGGVRSISVISNDSQSPSDDNSIHRERLFWAIYALDCYVTITTAQRSQLIDEDVQHFFSTCDSVWKERTPASLDESTVLRYQLDLYDLSRLVHRVYLAYRELEEYDDELVPWFTQFESISAHLNDWTTRVLPPSISLAPSQSFKAWLTPPLIMFHLFIHGLTIHLHGLVAYPALDSMNSPAYENARLESRSYCLLSIDGIARILAQLSDRETDKLGWPAAWSAWIAARYLLVEASYVTELKEELYHILSQFIGKMSTHWQVVDKYRRLLQRAVSELASNGLAESSALQQGKSVLALMKDLRVPVSNLEDQFRVDPMGLAKGFGQIDIPAGLAIPVGGHGNGPVSDKVAEQDMICSTEYSLPDQECDQWFALPLFASSAYQPHPFTAPSQAGSSALTPWPSNGNLA